MKASKRFCIVLCLFLALAAGQAAGETGATMEQQFKAIRETLCRVVTIEDKSFMFYVQNSPEWNYLYTLDGLVVGPSTCAPTSLANLIVNCVPYDDLGKIAELTYKPFRFDTDNINGNNSNPAKCFTVTVKEDYMRYLPLCITNYAMGNNKVGINGRYGNTFYYDPLLKHYGISYVKSKPLSYALEEVQTHDALVLVRTGGDDSPIAPNNGHYFVMVYASDTYVYFLDSFVKEEYKYDRAHIIEQTEPGVIRVKRENVNRLALDAMYIVYPGTNNHYTQADFEGILARSNALADR